MQGLHVPGRSMPEKLGSWEAIMLRTRLPAPSAATSRSNGACTPRQRQRMRPEQTTNFQQPALAAAAGPC